MFVKKKLAYDTQREVLVTIEIYDLTTKTILYTQNAKGFYNSEDDNRDITLLDGIDTMFIKAYELCMKDLKKKSTLK